MTTPPFAADCVVRLAVDLIAHIWDPVVLPALRAGRRRRIDLLGGIAGVSDKVLTQTLRRLHGNGLIVRITSPADRSVAYELSDLDGSLPDGPLRSARTAMGIHRRRARRRRVGRCQGRSGPR